MLVIWLVWQKNISYDDAVTLVKKVINNGEAYQKFLEIVENQGGDINNIEISSNKEEIYSNKNGILKEINALEVGKLSLSLGAGRVKKTDSIDYSVGIALNKCIGDIVNEGDLLMTLYFNKEGFTVNKNIFKID